MVDFLGIVIGGILGFLELLLVAWVISTWLIQFNVINMRNPTVRQIEYMLEAATRPMLAPVRRIVPSLGVIDISPLIVFLILEGLRRGLLPWLLGILARYTG